MSRYDPEDGIVLTEDSDDARDKAPPPNPVTDLFKTPNRKVPDRLAPDVSQVSKLFEGTKYIIYGITVFLVIDRVDKLTSNDPDRVAGVKEDSWFGVFSLLIIGFSITSLYMIVFTARTVYNRCLCGYPPNYEDYPTNISTGLKLSIISQCSLVYIGIKCVELLDMLNSTGHADFAQLNLPFGIFFGMSFVAFVISGI